MERNMRWDCLFRGLDWFMGLVAVLILLIAGLEVYALHVEQQADLALRVPLVLFLARWVGVAGIACLFLILGSLLVRAKTSCQ